MPLFPQVIKITPSPRKRLSTSCLSKKDANKNIRPSPVIFEQLQTSDLKFPVKGLEGHQAIIVCQQKYIKSFQWRKSPQKKTPLGVHHENLPATEKTNPWGANAKTWCFCVLLGWLAMGINDEKTNKSCFEKRKNCSKRKNKEVGNHASLRIYVTPQSKTAENQIVC